MGWAAVIGLGGIGIGLGAYAGVARRRGMESLWGVWLIAGMLLALCGAAALRVILSEDSNLLQPFWAYVLVIEAMAASVCCVTMAVVKTILNQQREFWAWSAAGSGAVAATFFGCLFTAQAEERCSLLLACLFFVCWGMASLSLRLTVYR